MENRKNSIHEAMTQVNNEQNFYSETQTQIKDLQETEGTVKNIMQQGLIKDILCYGAKDFMLKTINRS